MTRLAFRHVILPAALIGLWAASARPSVAATEQILFVLGDSASPLAPAPAYGVFTYDASLDGTTLGFNDLETLNINVLGVGYDLSYVKSGNFSPFYHFQFDSFNNFFVQQNILGFNTLFAAIKDGGSSGFYISSLNTTPTSAPLVAEYSFGNVRNYDTLLIRKTILAVPEASSLTLFGLVSVSGVALLARRKRLAR